MPKKSKAFGFDQYRAGGIERIGDAFLLLRAQNFAGSIYLAGRAVESLLRALMWRNDAEIRKGRKSLDTGHDMRELLTRVTNLGLLHRSSSGERDDLESRVQRVARLWYNNMRFSSTRYVETGWHELGEFGAGAKRIHKTFKQAATAFYNDCAAIVKQCEVLCERAK